MISEKLQNAINEQIAAEMESIVEELSNSDQNLVLNKLMDFPIIAGYDQVMSKQSGKRGMLFALLFPIGLPFTILSPNLAIGENVSPFTSFPFLNTSSVMNSSITLPSSSLSPLHKYRMINKIE